MFYSLQPCLHARYCFLTNQHHLTHPSTVVAYTTVFSMSTLQYWMYGSQTTDFKPNRLSLCSKPALPTALGTQGHPSGCSSQTRPILDPPFPIFYQQVCWGQRILLSTITKPSSRPSHLLQDWKTGLLASSHCQLRRHRELSKSKLDTECNTLACWTLPGEHLCVTIAPVKRRDTCHQLLRDRPWGQHVFCQSNDKVNLF